jgi:hypothetical protein
MTTLKNVLLINGVSSGVTGVGLIAFADLAAGLFGVTQTAAFVETGIFLVAFGVGVLYTGIRNPNHAGSVRVISMLDITWVVASLAIVLLQMFDLTALGYSLITAVALWVALMAYLQLTGLKNISTSKA